MDVVDYLCMTIDYIDILSLMKSYKVTYTLIPDHFITKKTPIRMSFNQVVRRLSLSTPSVHTQQKPKEIHLRVHCVLRPVTPTAYRQQHFSKYQQQNKMNPEAAAMARSPKSR